MTPNRRLHQGPAGEWWPARPSTWTAQRSGGRYGELCSNMELRDEKVAFFITSLPQGKRMITYRLRAEIPGSFHVLPLNAYAMYAPDVRCISDEGSLGIDDAAVK